MPQRERVILHVDINNCFASIETLYHPEVAGHPMAVAGDAENRRGVILAKNQLAKRYGVRTGEPIWEAKRKCPELMLLPPHHELYSEYSVKANEIYNRYTDLVEPASIDESYLDVTGSQRLFGNGVQMADDIRRVIQSELRLTVSVGVSYCKYFAKMGSDYKKPDATTVITRDNFASLLYPLPVTELYGVGAATARNLEALGVRTVGGLAELEEGLLRTRLGKHGISLYRCVHGLDDEPVRRPGQQEEAKSIGRGITYRRNLMAWEDIRTGLLPLAQSVGERLRESGLKCSGVQIAIKDPELKTIDRQLMLPAPANTTKVLLDAALELIERNWKVGEPIRLLTLTAINLSGEGAEQISLFAGNADARQENLDRSLDAVRRRYGESAVKPAALLKNDLGIGS